MGVLDGSRSDVGREDVETVKMAVGASELGKRGANNLKTLLGRAWVHLYKSRTSAEMGRLIVRGGG
jgi:hypothetical protein